MDATEFWAIRAGAAEIENPISPEKLALLGKYCGIRDGMRVLDVGCGKAWLLRKWAEQYQIEAVGLDINAHFIAEAAPAGRRERRMPSRGRRRRCSTRHPSPQR
jgi:2-polyprenyl-3-methyl-5-hydroxy-6-metoxy-1,4-benzoquinol methylase